MVWTCRGCFCLSLVLHSQWPAGAACAAEPKSDARLTVRLYNYAKVPVETMTGARRHATEVFRAAGIVLSWVECPISNDDVDKFRPCSDVTDPVVLVLRIVPLSMRGDFRRPPAVFGVASNFSAHVFSERVQDFAQAQQLPVQLVLGVVMAHELGHLLMGESSHSQLGIMRRNWRQEDFQPASRSLLFTRQQVKQMRALLARGQDAKGETSARRAAAP